jgi:hypothetical protein
MILILRIRAQARHLEGWPHMDLEWASWFETRCFAALLTMRANAGPAADAR